MENNSHVVDDVAKARWHYVLQIFAQNKNIDFTDRGPGAPITRLNGDGTAFRNFTRSFQDNVSANNLSPEGFFLVDGEPDYLFTAFFMLACAQEYNSTEKDELGRFQFKHSYQARLGLTRKNQVQYCFDEIATQIGLPKVTRPTRFLLSHDIDTVYGAIVEDGFNVIKKGRIDLFFRMLINVAIGRPDWLNMDQIMKLESEYDCKSVFFWIVEKGKINAREKNADYSFQSKSIQKHFTTAVQTGFDNGLHKSISPRTFDDEIRAYRHPVISNRYHYLKFSLPNGFDLIEHAGIQLDASLGYAEAVGFRNNYGLPYNPFNINENRPYRFVEVPLHIMDRTYFQYLRLAPEQAWNDIETFFEANRSNCVLSVLWHNNFFSNYKFRGYLELYKKILAYIRDNRFTTISQSEIIEQYSL